MSLFWAFRACSPCPLPSVLRPDSSLTYLLLLSTRPDNGFNEIPTGQSAHDSFWDFISLMPESTNMIAWQLSDRTIPRSLRHMQGFGVNTFVLVTKEGKRTYVK